MKKFLAFAAVLAASFAVYSQSPTGNDAMESQISRGLLDSRNREVITMRTENPNEILHGTVSYSGVFVQLAHADNKLQLINPMAPPEYRSGRENVIVDRSPSFGPSPTAGNGVREGLRLFSVRF